MPTQHTPWRTARFVFAALLGTLLPLASAALPAPTGESQRRDDIAQGVWASFPRVDAGTPCASDAPPWPTRLVAQSPGVLHETSDAARPLGVIIEVRSPVNPVARRSGMNLSLPITSIEDARILSGLPEGDQATDALNQPRILLEEPGSFIYRLPPFDPENIPRRDRNTAALTFRFASLRPVQRDERGMVLTAAIDRTWFQFYEPRGRPARGAVLLMPGMVATPPGTLSGITQLLLDDGWAVLRMLSQPARFNQNVVFNIDPQQAPEAQIEPMADLANQRAAEVAYAAQAAWAHLEHTRPDYAPLPKAVIGFSAGAITIPTTLAREPDRYKAAVLVGGGAEFFLTVEHCEFKPVTGVEIIWRGGRPSREVYERFSRAYLSRACLDPFHTAALARHVPSFVLMGGADQAVPSPLGDLLWERLGKPRRVRLDDANHLGLFLALPAHYGDIAEFLAQNVDGPAMLAPQREPTK